MLLMIVINYLAIINTHNILNRPLNVRARLLKLPVPNHFKEPDHVHLPLIALAIAVNLSYLMCMNTNFKCEIKLFKFCTNGLILTCTVCYHTVAPSFLACESVLSTVAYTEKGSVLVGTFIWRRVGPHLGGADCRPCRSAAQVVVA